MSIYASPEAALDAMIEDDMAKDRRFPSCPGCDNYAVEGAHVYSCEFATDACAACGHVESDDPAQWHIDNAHDNLCCGTEVCSAEFDVCLTHDRHGEDL